MKWFQLLARGLLAFSGMAMMMPVADACTRIVYHGEDGLLVTGRSMDWRYLKAAHNEFMPTR